MKVLILGSQGNLGTQLIKAFTAAKEYEVIGLDKGDFDLLDPLNFTEKINKLRPEIIINATAYNAVDKCEESEAEFELAKKINGEAVEYLASAALKVGALFIHYSTDYVFAGDQEAGYRETDAPQPLNNYGRSKLLGEQAVIKTGAAGLKYYLIRTSKLFGPRGASPLAKPSFFDLMLELAAKSQATGMPPELKIVDEEVSAFTYTSDLAAKTRELIETAASSGIYHVVNTGPATWCAAARQLFEIKGIHVKIKPVAQSEFPRPAQRPQYSYLLNTKIEPLRSYQEALRDYLG